MIPFGDFEDKFRKLDKSKIVIQPVPYDKTSTWLKGADKGPEALLEASINLELYDIETGFEVYKHGIYTAMSVVEDNTPEEMVESVYEAVIKWLNMNKFVVTLGGEHSVSIGAFKAFAEKFQNLTILQIDAHGDLRNMYHGSPFNHACVMARARELCPIIQVGIRAIDIEEIAYINQERIFYAENIYDNNLWIDKLCSLLTENVYITIDLDGFDPAVISATGTPEPGGLSWYQVLKLIKAVTQKSNLVGFDVVELCPNENNKVSEFVAAKLVYKILSYKFLNFQK
jgi:agmatinase